jgi:yecA family protein
MTETWNRSDIRDHVIDVHESCGIILAVATAPEIILPSVWMSLLYTNNDRAWSESSAAGDVLDRAMAYWNFVDDLIRAETAVPFPSDCRILDGQANDELDAFAEGYLRGQEWLEDRWEATGARHREPLSLILEFTPAALVYLCGNDAMRAEMRREHPRFPENPQELMELLPRVFGELGLIGRDHERLREDAAGSEF